MPKRSHTALLVLVLVLGRGHASSQPQSLRIEGSAGYLSEWQIDGTLRQIDGSADGAEEFSGPLTWTHVGLCSINGPETKRGEMTLRLSRSPIRSHSVLAATIWIERRECGYSGDLAAVSSGYMDCTDAKNIPVVISIK
jgi:hypothetical protein